MASNFSWLVGGNIISGAASFFSTIYLARVLEVAAFGLLNFAQAFLAYLLLMVDSGLSVFGMREIAREKEKVGIIFTNLLALRLLIALFIFLFACIILLWLPLPNYLRLFFGATFSIVLYRALNTEWVFQGMEKMKYVAFAKVSLSLLSLFLIFLLIRSSSDLVKVPIIQSLCGLSVSIFFLGWLCLKFLNFRLDYLSPKNWVNYFILSLPLGASMILIQIYANLDTIMLGFLKTPAVVGYYNAAYKIFYIFVGFFATWQATALPVVSRKIKENKQEALQFLEKYLKINLLATMPLIVLAFLSSPLLIRLIFGPSYSPAALALRILIWDLIAIVIGSTYGVTILIPAGLFNAFLASVSTGAIVNIIFNFLLIPKYSFVGAALATILAEVSAVFVSFFLAKKVFVLDLIKPLRNATIFTLGATIAYGAINYGAARLSLSFLNQIFALILFVIVYLILLLICEKHFIFSFVEEILRK